MAFFDLFRSKPVPQPQPVPRPQTITEALRQDARPRELVPVAQSANFILDTRSSGGHSRRGLSRREKTTIINHWSRRQNMRAAMDDSPPARTIVKRKNDSVVGNGLILDPTPDSNVLGIDDETLELWANNVKSRFHLWAKSKKSDITGRNNFYQNTRFYGWQYGRDGDVYVRLHYSDDPELTNPLQISFVDPNQIRGTEYTFSLGPQSQDTGIITDGNGKEIAYKVWIEDINRPSHYKSETIPAFDDINRPGHYRSETIPAYDPATGRPLMLHGYNPEYAGQVRGYPELGHALQEFEDMQSYAAATSKKMTQSASLGFTVKNMLQTPGDYGMPSLIGSGVEQVEVSTGETSSAPRTFTADSVIACQVNESTLTESGPYNLLGSTQGDELVQIKNEGPAETSGEFWDSQFRYLCASVGIPASVAMMKFDKSHSASRGELGILAISNEIIKDDIDSDFFATIYSAWMAGEIAQGTIRAPGFSDPLLRDAWLSHVLVGKPLPDVDPDKTMSAKTKALNLCLTDLDRESVLYNGSSGKANRAKMTRQIKEMPTNPFELESDEPPEPDIDDDEQLDNEE